MPVERPGTGCKLEKKAWRSCFTALSMAVCRGVGASHPHNSIAMSILTGIPGIRKHGDPCTYPRLWAPGPAQGLSSCSHLGLLPPWHPPTLPGGG